MTNMYREQLSTAIRERREALGLTKQQAARRCHCCEIEYGRAERGELDIDAMIVVAQHLGLEVLLATRPRQDGP